MVTFNPFDQSVCESLPIKFKVILYPAPILYVLGEISFVPRANYLRIKNNPALISGIVQKGALVDVYIDAKYVSSVKIQNLTKKTYNTFYFRLPKLTIGNHEIYLRPKKQTEPDIVSPPSQIFEFEVLPAK